jgi:predicted nucleotidyltransferase
VVGDPLIERIARRQAEARERGQRLLEIVPQLAERLRARGARSVVLFGSLATGSEPHLDTDVDLAVTGLDDAALAEATFELEGIAGARVDLVAFERAAPRLARRIKRDGQILFDASRAERDVSR